jgi:hypothetical protein
MIKIGVISDTHDSLNFKESLKKAEELFKDVQLILHAGDIIDFDVIKSLEKIAPVKAVYGNMDKDKLKGEFPRKQVVKVNNHNIALIHILNKKTNYYQALKKEFKNEKIDVAIFGHTHNPVNEEQKGILFFNPGSATDEIFATFKSVGILTINDKIKGRIIKLKV